MFSSHAKRNPRPKSLSLTELILKDDGRLLDFSRSGALVVERTFNSALYYGVTCRGANATLGTLCQTRTRGAGPVEDRLGYSQCTDG